MSPAPSRAAASGWSRRPASTARRPRGRWGTSTAVTSSRPTSRCALEAEFVGDPLDAFCRGVTDLDPPYAAFIGVSAPGAARAAVASLSPELFLRRVGGHRRPLRPIKGTARRAPPTPARPTLQSAPGLRRRRRDRAENVMIVDLVRNDLSRVARAGHGHRARAAPAPEPHPGVWHLVSYGGLDASVPGIG